MYVLPAEVGYIFSSTRDAKLRKTLDIQNTNEMNILVNVFTIDMFNDVLS